MLNSHYLRNIFNYMKILSKDVDSDEEGQMIYRTRNGRELVGGVHVRRVRPIAGGYG